MHAGQRLVADRIERAVKRAQREKPRRASFSKAAVLVLRFQRAKIRSHVAAK